MKNVQSTIRNFSGSAWEAKIKERGAYYSEIEEKVLEQLRKWNENSRAKPLITENEGNGRVKPLGTKNSTDSEGLNHTIHLAKDSSQSKERPFASLIIVG